MTYSMAALSVAHQPLRRRQDALPGGGGTVQARNAGPVDVVAVAAEQAEDSELKQAQVARKVASRGRSTTSYVLPPTPLMGVDRPVFMQDGLERPVGQHCVRQDLES